ncbi:MAG: phenylalanine--tRNA ligase subunit beta [Clostridiales Family XIII bacterium]|jgi:phenylalanyl-tRNA synthetase beta chain|nr:phenylalanine--tRNA ligase subunit beta [Clostridiales Family XIII bacterium]
MFVPLSWLDRYIDGGVRERDYAERFILSGSNIEQVHVTGGDEIRGVVLGKLLDVRPHPDSDHLVICAADVGAASEAGRPLQIVTGASNVKTGQYVPVVMHGGVCAGGLKIKKGKLRGEMSEGMLCSAQELGFDDKVVPLMHKDGIWILPEEFRRDELIGADVLEVLGLRGAETIEFEITPNRPDCLSVLGIAREFAAVYDRKLLYPETLERNGADAGYPAEPAAEDFIRVEIAKPELCGRYIARVATDIVIKESPWPMQRSLMLAGMRPINNIVDITNFVMLELGHPIHAFDIRQIEGGVIRVDTAADGERFVTLDGQERTLFSDTLMIKDGVKAVAAAGIMGGLNSEIREDTATILIEAASFDADCVRRTSKKLGIRSEASARYEKGVPAELSRLASDRVCALIRETGAGRVLAGAADAYPVRTTPPAIPVRTARVNAVLGTDIAEEEMKGFLRRLEMVVSGAAEAGVFEVTPPYVRLDVKEEIDVVEEVARIYGYDVLDTTIHADTILASASKSWTSRDLARAALTGYGLSEIQTYSFVAPAGAALIGAGEDPAKTDFVRLINPLGEENSVMRTTLLPGMLAVLAHNFNHSSANAEIFEIGNTFHSLGENALPREELSLCLGIYGERGDFFFVKAVIEKLFAKLGIKEPLWEAEENDPSYHPGRCARVFAPADEPILIGTVGEIHPDTAARFDIDSRIFAAELSFDKIAELADTRRAYTPLRRYPAVLRDLALLAAEETTVFQIESVVRAKGGGILESVRLFDVYRGKQVPEGKKSLAFNLTFRGRDRTLTDEEVAKAIQKILKGLEEEAGAILRDS